MFSFANQRAIRSSIPVQAPVALEVVVEFCLLSTRISMLSRVTLPELIEGLDKLVPEVAPRDRQPRSPDGRSLFIGMDEDDGLAQPGRSAPEHLTEPEALLEGPESATTDRLVGLLDGDRLKKKRRTALAASSRRRLAGGARSVRERSSRGMCVGRAA